ncbi:piggyBac transposable element-derived protein 3-like [Cydia splendana]|uniref:piggyBac transposable element-derived protein 3-like n=1 Tax=Cydia splendana TaxID=1100963 RepID=UPI00300D1AAB
MSRKRRLQDTDIAAALCDDDASEDGLEFDDDSIADPDFDPEMEGLTEEMVEELIDEFGDASSDGEFDNHVDTLIRTLQNDEITTSTQVEPIQSTSSDCNLPASRSQGKKPKKLNLRWKKKNLELNALQLAFKGNETLSPDTLELDTPVQFFLKLFPPELIETIVEQTNLYVVQKDPSNTFRVTDLDIRQFIGIVFLMSLIKLPRVTSHWAPILGTELIQRTMALNKFEKIRQLLHFNDNSKAVPRSDPNHDRIFKFRPVVDTLNTSYKEITLEKQLCVDEQMCSTKARNVLKRYNPNKPHKWGYKIYVLSGVSGFAYKTEIETGTENVVNQGEPDLGASSNVVMRLARIIPRHENFRLYFDNYFTSLPLLEYLVKEGILSLGTIRRNRIPDCKLSSEKVIKKKERGYSEEYVADVNGVEVSTVVWKDNKVVTLASTFAGQNPISDVSRYDKKQSKYIDIKRPFVVAEYNRHMGGVDLIDSIMGIYKIQLRSKRWPMRLFYHYLDLSIANAWLLYKRVCKHKIIPKKSIKGSADFRLDVAASLCQMGTKSSTTTRRSLETEIVAKKRKGPTQHAPPQAVRQDQIGHWPYFISFYYNTTQSWNM